MCCHISSKLAYSYNSALQLFQLATVKRQVCTRLPASQSLPVLWKASPAPFISWPQGDTVHKLLLLQCGRGSVIFQHSFQPKLLPELHLHLQQEARDNSVFHGWAAAVSLCFPTIQTWAVLSLLSQAHAGTSSTLSPSLTLLKSSSFLLFFSNVAVTKSSPLHHVCTKHFPFFLCCLPLYLNLTWDTIVPVTCGFPPAETPSALLT